MTNRDRAIFAVAWVLILSGIAVIALLAIRPANIFPVQPHHVTLRYNPDGVQMTCPASELGWTATITGDGPRAFTARCDADGPVINVWDALP